MNGGTTDPTTTGEAPDAATLLAVLDWGLDRNGATSATLMARVLCGLPQQRWAPANLTDRQRGVTLQRVSSEAITHPHDIYSFAECLTLLEAAPGLRARLHLMGRVSEAWWQLMAIWAVLEVDYRAWQWALERERSGERGELRVDLQRGIIVDVVQQTREAAARTFARHLQQALHQANPVLYVSAEQKDAEWALEDARAVARLQREVAMTPDKQRRAERERLAMERDMLEAALDDAEGELNDAEDAEDAEDERAAD